MEILRFDDGGTPSHPRKKSSRGMLVVGLVATLFGISSAFASSTIAINGNAPIALGQGVSFVTGCDTTISVSPRTSMAVKDTTPTFFLDSIEITNVDTRTAGADGLGCANKTFDVQIYRLSGSTTAYNCDDLKLTSPFSVAHEDSATLPITGDCADSKVSFRIPAGITATNPVFIIPFTEAPSDMNYITLVSRNS
jgi:hypothetical protein